MLSCSFLRLLHKFFSVKFQSGYQMWRLHIANHTATKRVTCRATCKGRRQALKFENFYCLWHHYMWLIKVHFWWLCGLQCAIFISDKISVHLSKKCLVLRWESPNRQGGGGHLHVTLSFTQSAIFGRGYHMVLFLACSWCFGAAATRGMMCMKPRWPPLTNVGTQTAFRHDHLQAFPKK